MYNAYNKIWDGDFTKFGKIAVLCGGFSAEREISLMSGDAVYQSLKNSGADVIKLDMQKQFAEELAKEEFDTAFIALHGVGGEDGKVQALLDLRATPYTGSHHAASALAMNKLNTKLVWKSLGLPSPEFLMLEEECAWVEVLQQLSGTAFVKPIHEGSSLGVCKADTPEQLKTAYFEARKYDPFVMAESFVDGPEYSVAILGNSALPSIEVQIDSKFYDYNAKYFSDETRYICPSSLNDEKENEIKYLALKAFKSLGCTGWGRVDFMQNREGDFYLLEVNTVPGMTNHSLVPMAAKAAGLSFDELVMEILEVSRVMNK